MAAAQRRLEAERARAAAVTLGLAADVEPREALLEEIGRTAGAVRWLEARIRNLNPDMLTWGTVSRVSGRQAQGRVDFTESRAAPHVLWQVYQAERAHLVTACRVAITAGIEERRVQLAERLGGVLADTIAAVLDEMDLSADQRAAAETLIVPRHLRLLAGGLGEQEAG